jgi:hypothetical protein
MKYLIIFFLFFYLSAHAQEINKVTVYLEEGEKGKDSYASIKEITIENKKIKLTESYTGKYKDRKGRKIECEITDALKDELKSLVIKNDFLKNTLEIFNILPPVNYKKIKINFETSQGYFRTEFEGAEHDYRSSQIRKKIEPLITYLQSLYLNSNLKCKTE